MEPEAWGFSLFCDDIRSEVAAKVTVVGIYQMEMIFPVTTTFPTIFPKFGIFVKYYEQLNVFDEDVNFHVYLPGGEQNKPLIFPVHRSKIAQIQMPTDIEPDQTPVVNLTMPLIFSPLLIMQPGFIKVRAHCGDTITNLGSLKIRTATEAEMSDLQFGVQPVPNPIPTPASDSH